jgi:hypothetical protein
MVNQQLTQPRQQQPQLQQIHHKHSQPHNQPLLLLLLLKVARLPLLVLLCKFYFTFK